MRKDLALSIFFFARLFLVSALLFGSSLFSFSTKSLQAYNIEGFDSPLATIQGRVWFDDDPSNGILDTEDPGVANVLVELYTQAGLSQRILTDEQGVFEFTNLTAATYDLKFFAPMDYAFTAGSDSDADRETGRIENIEISDSRATVDGLLVGLVEGQRRAPSSIGLDLFEVSPKIQNGLPAVFIEWETSREEGTESFQILRSSTGSRDEAIEISGLIPSQGSANSTTVNRYEHWDPNTLSGTIYSYWLREKDTSGVITEYGPKFTAGVGARNGNHPPPVVGGVDTPQTNFVYLPLVVR